MRVNPLSQKVLSRTVQTLLGTVALTGAFACAAQTSNSLQTSWGTTVNEPSLPAATAVCAIVKATQTPVNGRLADSVDSDTAKSAPDTSTIQNAIGKCAAGQAVHLVQGESGQSGFLIGPITLKSGVTLWIDKGITVFGSRNPADYDNGAGLCGIANTNSKASCKALINASKLTNAGIVGGGVIDGRGGAVLSTGPNAGVKTWWDVAYQTKTSNVTQHNPRLLDVQGGSNFTLYGVTFENSPNFHIVLDNLDGVTAWGIKILSPSAAYTQGAYACPKKTTPDQVSGTYATCFTPETVKNTDGFDPGESSHVVLAYSYISTGDDHVAVKAGSGNGSQHLLFANDHLYYGHGLSIGSETNTGVSDVTVQGLVVDGHESANGVGIRIKSDASRGGVVSGVTYQGVCMQGVRQPLVFDSYYSSSKGKKYPWFKNITINGLHNLGSVAYGGGQAVFAAYAKYPLQIALNNVQFDGTQPTTYLKGHNGSPSVLPANTAFTFGPGTVSFAQNLTQQHGTGVTFAGSITESPAPVDCSNAFVKFSSVQPDAPI
jgi:polygalacturonase